MSSLLDRVEADLASVVYSGKDWSETVTRSHAGVSRRINVVFWDKSTVSDELGIGVENAEPFYKGLEADLSDLVRGDSITRKDGTVHYVTSVSEPEEGECVVFVSTDEPHG